MNHIMNQTTLLACVAVAIGIALLTLTLLFRNTKLSPQKLVRCALISALYIAICLSLAPFSYGAIQVRIAEALCLLPIFGVEYIVAVTLGCFLTNLIGSTVLDVIFGTLATLIACIFTYLLRNKRIKGLAILPSIPPVITNAIIIGSMISFFFMGDTPASTGVWLFNMLTVGIGQAISCSILGTMLVRLIERNPALHSLFTKD